MPRDSSMRAREETTALPDRQRACGSPGPVEQTLHDLGVADPAALARAAVIDHTAEQLILDHARPGAATNRQAAGPGFGTSTGSAQLANHVLASCNPNAAAVLTACPAQPEREREQEP
jgi:hypothetical protein